MKKLLNRLKRYGELMPDSPFNYVTLHPLADEPEMLLKLGISAEECISCDLYLVYFNYFIFVSIWNSPSDIFGEECFVGYHYESVGKCHQFNVFTKEKILSKKHIESAIIYIINFIENNNKILKKGQAKTKIISKEDICTAIPGESVNKEKKGKRKKSFRAGNRK